MLWSCWIFIKSLFLSNLRLDPVVKLKRFSLLVIYSPSQTCHTQYTKLIMCISSLRDQGSSKDWPLCSHISLVTPVQITLRILIYSCFISYICLRRKSHFWIRLPYFYYMIHIFSSQLLHFLNIFIIRLHLFQTQLPFDWLTDYIFHVHFYSLVLFLIKLLRWFFEWIIHVDSLSLFPINFLCSAFGLCMVVMPSTQLHAASNSIT